MRTALVISIGFSLVGLSCGVEDFDVEPGSDVPAESLESISNEVVGGWADHRIDAVGYVLPLIASVERPQIGFPQCSGALIGPRAFVTAAHCVPWRNVRYVVGFGDYEWNATREIPVDKVLLHPSYRFGAPRGYETDVAVLILRWPSPATPFAIRSATPGAIARFVGYGNTKPTRTAPRVDTIQRRVVYQRAVGGNSSSIITMGVGGGLCFGDGGGPLINESGRTIAGVASELTGMGRCEAGNYARFASLTANRAFVNQALRCQTGESAVCRRLAGAGMRYWGSCGSIESSTEECSNDFML